MQRRTFLTSAAATAATSQLRPSMAFAGAQPNWDQLRRKVAKRLIDIRSPLIECARNGGAGAAELFAALKNPYYLGDEPALTQSLGWIDAWTSEPSLKGVAAESAEDVAAAIDFGRHTGIPIVVKGGGHSYFGNSNRAGSLLIWTHRLRKIELHDAFRPSRSPAGAAAVSAISVGAGCIWGEVYRKAGVEHGRYVQGGGCLTVGVGGFVLGGGFGSLSKQFGTGASNLLEAEIVTADGRIRTVNAWNDPELFFAIRGGGGGTFGLVTRLTLKTQPMPSTIGAMLLSVRAADDASWHDLVEKVMTFYTEKLFNPSWGEQLRFEPGRTLTVTMVCHGRSQQEIEAVWAPLVAWIKQRPNAFAFKLGPLAVALPGRAFWDPAMLGKIPGLVLKDSRPGVPAENIFWQSNLGETAQVLHAYDSAWLPAALLVPERRRALVEAIVRASAIWSITLHTNKGLAGGSAEAIASARETATNPEVLDAFALLICAAEEGPAYPGIAGHEPKIAEGRRQASHVSRAMQEIRRLVPNAGAYMSESNYFQSNWKQAYWGSNYPRLAAAKRRYDPHSLFRGRNCVEPS